MLKLNADRAFIIAEAGTWHADPDPDKRLSKAASYVKLAAHAGADAVKFQIFNPPIQDDMFCWIDGDEDRVKAWGQSALSLEEWRRVKDYCDELGIMFLASTFQTSTVKWLGDLGVEATKVASRAAKDFPYDEAPEPYLISLGMYNTAEIIQDRHFVSQFIFLECEAKYPSTMRWNDYYIGFSDHSGTPWYGIDAIARGCQLLEVHVKTTSEWSGPDFAHSLGPSDLRLLCQARDGMAAHPI